MSDETTPGLRDRIIKALTAENYRRSRQGILASPEIHSAAMADAALAVVRTELDRRDAEIEELRTGRIVAALFAYREEDCPRPFSLIRRRDITGDPGEGIVAYGAQFADGTVVIRWLGDHASTIIWDSLDKAMHGHQDLTVAWLAEDFSDLAGIERRAEQAEATIARVREAIKGERAAARRIVDEGRDQGGAWVNLMHSCAMFLMAFEPAEPTDPIKAHLDQQPPAVCTCSSDLMSIHDCAVHGADLRCSPGCRIHGQRGEST